jgi:hypothetical protein
MFLNQPQFPVFYTFNDLSRKAEEAAVKTIDFNKQLLDNTIAYFDSITDNQFTTYTKKAVTLNQNMAEDAKKILKSEANKTKAGN